MKRVKVTVTRSLCASCGLKSSHCQCREQALNENGDNGESAFKLTPASFCVLYLMYALLAAGLYLILFMPMLVPRSCYLEIFADSFFVSNVSNATADWNVGFTTRSPANKCKFSLHTIKSRLLHGDKLISQSATHDYVRLIVTEKINDIPLPYAVFKTLETPRDRVVWDLQVEVLSSVKIDGQCHHKDGFLILTCGNIPVNFTADPAGNVKGTFLGYMRPCEYLFREEFPLTYF